MSSWAPEEPRVYRKVIILTGSMGASFSDHAYGTERSAINILRSQIHNIMIFFIINSVFLQPLNFEVETIDV